MIDIKQERSQDDWLRLTANRSKRLVRLLELKAPLFILVKELELVQEAFEEWRKPFPKHRYKVSVEIHCGTITHPDIIMTESSILAMGIMDKWLDVEWPGTEVKTYVITNLNTGILEEVKNDDPGEIDEALMCDPNV